MILPGGIANLTRSIIASPGSTEPVSLVAFFASFLISFAPIWMLILNHFLLAADRLLTTTLAEREWASEALSAFYHLHTGPGSLLRFLPTGSLIVGRAQALGITLQTTSFQ